MTKIAKKDSEEFNTYKYWVYSSSPKSCLSDVGEKEVLAANNLNHLKQEMKNRRAVSCYIEFRDVEDRSIKYGGGKLSKYTPKYQ